MVYGNYQDKTHPFINQYMDAPFQKDDQPAFCIAQKEISIPLKTSATEFDVPDPQQELT